MLSYVGVESVDVLQTLTLHCAVQSVRDPQSRHCKVFWDLYTSGKIWGRVLKMSQPQDQPPPYQSPTAPSDKGCYELQAQTGGQAESPNKIIQMPPAPVLGMDPGSKFSSIWNELLVVQILWNKLSLDCVKLFPLAEEVRGGSNYIELTFLTI